MNCPAETVPQVTKGNNRPFSYRYRAVTSTFFDLQCLMYIMCKEWSLAKKKISSFGKVSLQLQTQLEHS